MAAIKGEVVHVDPYTMATHCQTQLVIRCDTRAVRDINEGDKVWIKKDTIDLKPYEPQIDFLSDGFYDPFVPKSASHPTPAVEPQPEPAEDKWELAPLDADGRLALTPGTWRDKPPLL